MSTRQRRSSAFNANLRLPEGLSELLISEVKNLPSCPKSDYLKSEFLTKFVSKDTAPAIVRRNRAISKWLATERENEATNTRLMNTHPDFQILPGVEWCDFLEFLRNTVCGTIGETVPEEALCGPFSGGASTSRKRTNSHPAGKYLGKAHVTPECLIHLESLYEAAPGWSGFWAEGLRLEVVPGNVMFTVPKTTDIDRVACKEPDINMFLQKGAGRVIRQCLRRQGIDLNDQSRNRDLARLGSINGNLATVDLSSASDSVSRELVQMVLPPFWFSHLESIRSRVTMIDGEEHVNEMFSSMGNGFTFELESLLFYALTRTICYFTGTRGVVSVYGDDIIAPATVFADLEWVFGWFGFSVNTKKSFSTGPFRESCGGHYVGGLDITPFYVREPIDTLSDLILFVNALRHWSETSVGVNDPSVFPLWEFASSFIPPRFWGAADYATRYQVYGAFRVARPMRLLPVERRVSTGTGGYIHWLNSTAFRTSPGDGIATSERSVVSARLVESRVRRTVNLAPPPFYQEVA